MEGDTGGEEVSGRLHSSDESQSAKQFEIPQQKLSAESKARAENVATAFNLSGERQAFALGCILHGSIFLLDIWAYQPPSPHRRSLETGKMAIASFSEQYGFPEQDLTTLIDLAATEIASACRAVLQRQYPRVKRRWEHAGEPYSSNIIKSYRAAVDVVLSRGLDASFEDHRKVANFARALSLLPEAPGAEGPEPRHEVYPPPIESEDAP